MTKSRRPETLDSIVKVIIRNNFGEIQTGDFSFDKIYTAVVHKLGDRFADQYKCRDRESELERLHENFELGLLDFDTFSKNVEKHKIESEKLVVKADIISHIFMRALGTYHKPLIKKSFEEMNINECSVRSIGSNEYTPWHLIAFPNKELNVNCDKMIDMIRFVRDLSYTDSKGKINKINPPIFALNSNGETGFAAVNHNKLLDEETRSRVTAEICSIDEDQVKFMFNTLNKITGDEIHGTLFMPEILLALVTDPELCAKILISQLTKFRSTGNMSVKFEIRNYICFIRTVVQKGLECFDMVEKVKPRLVKSEEEKIRKEKLELKMIDDKIKHCKEVSKNSKELSKLYKAQNAIKRSVKSLEANLRKIDNRILNFIILKEFLVVHKEKELLNIKKFFDVFSKKLQSSEMEWISKLPDLEKDFNEKRDVKEKLLKTLSQDNSDRFREANSEFIEAEHQFNLTKDQIRNVASIAGELARNGIINPKAFVDYVKDKGKTDIKDTEFDIWRLLQYYSQAEFKSCGAWKALIEHPQCSGIKVSVAIEKILERVFGESDRENRSGILALIADTQLKISSVKKNNDSQEIDYDSKVRSIFGSRSRIKTYSDEDVDDFAYALSNDVLKHIEFKQIFPSILYNICSTNPTFIDLAINTLKLLHNYDGKEYIRSKEISELLSESALIIDDLRCDFPTIIDGVVQSLTSEF